jgi:SAM-dependent methyltransferase
VVARELGLDRSSTVLDLAAGTGKLTRLLLPLVGRVIAVDPAPAMLAKLRERVPGADAMEGTAEAIPLPDAAVDAVFVAQAFHWFGTATACHEIARVLAPGGGLALLWNEERWDDRGHAWLPAFRALNRPHRQAAGEFPTGQGRSRQTLEQTGLFEPLSRRETEHVHRLSPSGFVALVASWSWIVNLPERQRSSVLGEVHELVRDQPELALRYRTEVYWTRATGSRGARR